jgi:hypothetical protein
VSSHNYVAHERDGWSVCIRCGMVRNYDREVPCRGTAPGLGLRDADGELDAAREAVGAAWLTGGLSLADAIRAKTAFLERMAAEAVERPATKRRRP